LPELVPLAAIEYERPAPLLVRDPERVEEHLLRELRERLAGGDLDAPPGSHEAERAVAPDRPWLGEYWQVHECLRPVVGVIELHLGARRRGIAIVAGKAGLVAQQVEERDALLAGIRVRDRGVAEPGNDRLVGAQQAAIDSGAGQQGYDALGERAHLVRPVAVVAVEVLLLHQRALVVDGDGA